jgi:predicted ATPase
LLTVLITITSLQPQQKAASLQFIIIVRSQQFPRTGKNAAYLRIDQWNDYSFVTMFDVVIFDEDGGRYDLGSVKIGFSGQTEDKPTYSTLNSSFECLPDTYFSMGQDISYYHTLSGSVSSRFREAFLHGLRDVVIDKTNRENASGQEVFKVAFLRSVSISTIDGQFQRVLKGGAPQSDFNFEFLRHQSDTVAGIDLGFVVAADSTPSTNIHAVIGRNGVGKTMLLNDMIAAIMRPDTTEARFYVKTASHKMPIDPTYFSSLVSVAFSAFDPFNPPQEQPDPERGTRYYYIGLKDIADETGTRLKSLRTLHDECVASLAECFSNKGKRERWRTAISTLESDENFALMNLGSLADLFDGQLKITAKKLVERMSSGHAIVFLTISRLVAKVEEKTLVIMDEPESHLHPPLLSALTRALSELLHNRNGVAIIATHSPVILQEVPKSCAWIITRSRLSMHPERPRIETFGENVGVLTREVFGLEVSKSGFHSLLQAAVEAGESYDSIIDKYDGQIGLEARGILRAMIAARDTESSQA